MKTNIEIIEGIKIRLARLEQTLDIVSKHPEKLVYVEEDCKSKIDELESLLEWISKQ